MSWLKHSAHPVHGMYFRQEDNLGWWQYWVGVQHCWALWGIPVWYRLRQRNRPMHEFISKI